MKRLASFALLAMVMLTAAWTGAVANTSKTNDAGDRQGTHSEAVEEHIDLDEAGWGMFNVSVEEETTVQIGFQFG